MIIKATSLALGLVVAALALPAAAQDMNRTAPDHPMMNRTAPDQPMMNHDNMNRVRMDQQAGQHDMHDMGRNGSMQHRGWSRRHQVCHWTWRRHHRVRVCNWR